MAGQVVARPDNHPCSGTYRDRCRRTAKRPVLVVASDDGLGPSNDAFVTAYRKAGGKDITVVHLTTDHSYSDQRIALESVVLEFLEKVKKQ